MSPTRNGIKDYYQLIKREQVEETLHSDKGPDAELEDFEIRDFTEEGDNFLSCVTSVFVNYKKGDELFNTSYIVKVNPGKSDEMNTFINIVFSKEIHFLVKLLPLLNAELARINEEPLKVPRCFYHNGTIGEEILYYQDLRLDNYKMYDKTKSMDIDHVNMVVKELSKLHASSMLLTSRGSFLRADLIESFPTLENWSDTVEKKGATPVYKDLVTSFLETGAAIASKCKGYEKVAQNIRTLRKDSRKLYEEQLSTTDQFQVITHSDCWSNNWLFRYGDDGKVLDCQLIDWQMVTAGSLALDLNYFVYNSLDGEGRKEVLESMFTTYYASFASILSGSSLPMKFTLQQLKDEFFRKNFYGLVTASVITPLILGIPFDVDFITGANNEEKFEKYQDELLATIEDNKLLKPRFLSLLDDMVDSGVLEK